MKDATVLASRLLLAQIFFIAGIGKIGTYAGTAGYMASAGVPGILLPLVIALEVVGALALVAGWQTRWAALALALFTLAAAVLFHTQFGEPMQSVMFMKNLALTGGLLLLAVHGPGRYSLDARWGVSAPAAEPRA